MVLFHPGMSDSPSLQFDEQELIPAEWHSLYHVARLFELWVEHAGLTTFGRLSAGRFHGYACLCSPLINMIPGESHTKLGWFGGELGDWLMFHGTKLKSLHPIVDSGRLIRGSRPKDDKWGIFATTCFHRAVRYGREVSPDDPFHIITVIRARKRKSLKHGVYILQEPWCELHTLMIVLNPKVVIFKESSSTAVLNAHTLTWFYDGPLLQEPEAKGEEKPWMRGWQPREA